MRDELHDIAPLPWRAAGRGRVDAANGVSLLQVDTDSATFAHDEHIADLLVAVVNGPDGTADETVAQRAADDLRRMRERAVLDAAREYAANRGGKLHVRNIAPLLDAAEALDAAPATGGAT